MKFHWFRYRPRRLGGTSTEGGGHISAKLHKIWPVVKEEFSVHNSGKGQMDCKTVERQTGDSSVFKDNTASKFIIIDSEFPFFRQFVTMFIEFYQISIWLDRLSSIGTKVKKDKIHLCAILQSPCKFCLRWTVIKATMRKYSVGRTLIVELQL